MNFFKTIIIFFAIISFSSIAKTVAQLAVGHGDVNASFIKPYHSEYDFFLVGKDGDLEAGGSWTDKVEIIEKENIRYLKRKVVRFSKLGMEELKRVTIGQHKTLAPISNHQSNGESLDVITFFHFDDKRISAALIKSASFDIKRLDVTLDQAPFDLSYWAILASSLPFEVGYQAALPVYSPGSNKVGWEEFKVIGNESIEIDNKSYDTFIVEASPSNWKFWLRKEYPYIVKIDHPYGETRAVSFFKYISPESD
jgi:hypothetical protein